MNCWICSNRTVPFGTAIVLGKYRVQYFSCEHCGFIQAEEPYWLTDAYSSAITKSDVGLVGRNLVFAAIGLAVMSTFFNARSRFLDYGGYGLLVRLMRDAGFDFYRYDSLCANLFAEGFDIDEQNPGAIELVTAVEVFEHLTHPLDTIAHMLKFSKNILFTTDLVPPHRPLPSAWPYYGTEHGQHIGLHTARSLAIVAEQFQLNYCSYGKSFHLFSEEKISAKWFRWITHYRVARFMPLLSARQSLLEQDHARAMQRPRS
jgi:hypothetical protein